MNRRLHSLLVLALLNGCDHDTGPTAAERTFAAFQAALQRGDEAACRELLTLESAAVLGDMSWQHASSQQPLEVLGSRHENGVHRVQVTDPNAGDERSEFIVVREYGRLVVDLVATATCRGNVRNAGGPVEATSGREDFEPRALTPADYDRIRAYELAQPRR